MDFDKILNNILDAAKCNKNVLPYIRDSFYPKYEFLRQIKGLENLIKKFNSQNVSVKILDNVVEFCLAYDILKKNPNASIQYEPEIYVENKKYTPDFRIEIGDELFYVQVKNNRKSFDYDNKAKSVEIEENENFQTNMVIVDDVPQIVRSLIKAAQFQPIEKCTYIIVQQIIFGTIDKIDVGNVLYGREIIVSNDNLSSPQLRRMRTNENSLETSGGFLFSKQGEIVSAYVLAITEDVFFGDRKYEIFKKDKNDCSEDKVGLLIDYDKVYDPTTYIL